MLVLDAQKVISGLVLTSSLSSWTHSAAALRDLADEDWSVSYPASSPVFALGSAWLAACWPFEHLLSRLDVYGSKAPSSCQECWCFHSVQSPSLRCAQKMILHVCLHYLDPPFFWVGFINCMDIVEEWAAFLIQNTQR